MSLPIPFGPKYQARVENGSTGTECVLCGKQTSRNGRSNGTTIHVRVVDGGGRFATPDEVVDARGDMGYFPVGSECAKSLPDEYKVTL